MQGVKSTINLMATGQALSQFDGSAFDDPFLF
jgi:hypothetical protein